MIDGIPRLSVLIITYKQEELIKRAIDSLLAQKDYIYEICVSDDCSPDKTWDVLQEYDRQYPGLFKLNRNEPNLGIFENYEKTWTMATGDLVYALSGDDECGDGWFMKVIKYICENNIDYKNELFCIYGDYRAVYPQGDSFIYSNSAVNKYNDAVSLSFRGYIGNRSCCFSSKVLNAFVKVSQGHSYIAESAIDHQLQALSQKNYYIPYVGNVYYTGIGVNVRLRKGDKQIERERVEAYAKEVVESLGYVFNKKDTNFVLLKTQKACLYRENRIIGRAKILFLFIKSFRIDYILQYFRDLNRIIFAVRRRLPHKTPIHVTI